MRVLLITFSFPPAGGVGVLRALSLAKYLPAQQIDLHVLTARNAPSVGRDASLQAQVPEVVDVHRSWTLDLPFALRKAIKQRISRQSPRQSLRKDGKAGSSGGSFVKRLIGNLLLPDPQVGWLPFALPAARKIIRRHDIEAVLITVPPFSTTRLVSSLRRSFPDLPLILDFRDEWLSTTLHFVSFNNNARAKEIASRTEGNAVRDATRVVLVTEEARRELMERYPQEDPAKFVYLPNGFETATHPGDASPAPADGPPATLLLSYLGSVYGSTDPSSFVEGVLALPADLRSRLRLRFIGRVETASLRATLEQLGDTIEIRGFVPQSEALETIAESDLLLLVTHDRINVSAKFYDYLAGGKPIFAVVHPDGEVRRLLEETGAGLWADIGDPLAIRDLLASVLSGQATFPQPVPERIATYHRQDIARRYAGLLHGLRRKDSA